MRFLALLAGVYWTMALAAPASAQLPPSGFSVGDPFPVRPFATLDGSPASIADYRGEKVILHIFASW